VSQPCPTSCPSGVPVQDDCFLRVSQCPIDHARNARKAAWQEGSRSNRMEILEIAISTGTLGHQMTFGGDKTNVVH